MNQRVLLLLLLVTVLAITVLLLRPPSEPFTDVISDEVIEAGQERFNKFMNLVDLANPQIPLNPATAAAVDSATNSLSSGSNNQGVTVPFKIPTAPSPNLGVAQSVCEVVATPDCSAFQTPAFAANCGISFDIKGKDSKGNPHRGGLFISAEDRSYQEQRATSLGLAPDDIQFTPTFGQSRKGQFAVDAPTCQILQESIQCKTTRDFTAPNCTQCFTSSEFHRVDPTAYRIVPLIVVQTNATSLVVNGVTVPITADTPLLPQIDRLVEGTPIVINVAGPVANSSNPALYFAGYISTPTIQGTFNLDLNALLSTDTVTGYRPRLQGTSQLSLNGANPVQCFNLVPQPGSSTMNLTGLMPFSFLDPSQYDARSCDNGPFVTQSASATFLNSDPCYDPASSKPGAYSTACLQQLFLGMGGTAAGSGYPSNDKAALQLNQTSTGTPRSLTDIGTFLSNMAVQAATGMNNGQELSIPDWSAASVFMTGVPITSPCFNSPTNGPLTAECLTYLYTNGGANNSIDKSTGPTYTLGATYATQDACGNAIYCTPDGTLNPASPGGLKVAQATGGIAAVQALYDKAHKTANDNTLPNTQRRAAIQQCYGDILEHTNPEVFWVGGSTNNGYSFTQDQAAATCAQVGAVVATTAQLTDAQKNGAQWCSGGWVADNSSGQFPMQVSGVPGCAKGPLGVGSYGGAVGGPSAIGVNCYGSKPDPANLPSGLIVLPFYTGMAPDSSQPNGWNYNTDTVYNATFSD